MDPEQPNVVIETVSGSRAYGLHRPDSDTDTVQIIAAAPAQVLGLAGLPKWPHRKGDGTEGDLTRWELGKFLDLALRGNPQALEVLFTPERNVARCTDQGHELRELRGLFPSRLVHLPYFKYAESQRNRMARDGRSAHGHKIPEGQDYDRKAALHCLRLLLQEIGLHRSGVLAVDLSDTRYYDTDMYQDLLRVRDGGMSLGAVLDWINDLLEQSQNAAATSVLPDQPKRRQVDEWLIRTRRYFLAE